MLNRAKKNIIASVSYTHLDVYKRQEVMTVPLSDRNGRISAGAIDEILKRVAKADTVLIGCLLYTSRCV